MEGDISVAFESKAPHTTPWLSVQYPVGEEPVELFAKLAAIGWKQDQFAPAPPLDGIQEIRLVPPKGAGLFFGWTDAEARKHMPLVRRVLRTEGFGKVPWNRLTWDELL